jgi:predicted CopG family antitoxin
MDYTTISIKKETKKELKKLKSQFESRSMDELLSILILDAKKKYVDEFSKDFKQRLEEKNLTLKDIIQAGEKIRKEILNTGNQK